MSDELDTIPASGLKEAIAHIQQTAAKDTAKKIPIDNTNTVLIVKADGEIKETIQPALRTNAIKSVADIGKLHDYFAELARGDKPSIWIDQQGVTVIQNDSGDNSPRKDRAVLMFEKTNEYLKILGLDAIDPRTGKQQVISQQQFLKLTRTTFYDAFISPAARNTLQGMLKSMSANTELGKGALSLSTTSREGEFPDFITLYARVFNDPALRDLPRREIRVHIEILPQGSGFELTPNPQDIDQAEYTEVDNLTNILQGDLDESALLFFGSPEPRPETEIE